MIGSIAFANARCKAVSVLLLAVSVQAGTPFGSSFGIPGDNATYDYVIVGGGTAGLTLATRLIEQSAGSVAIVEAGSFYEISNGNLSQIPGNDVAFSWKSPHDWQPLVDWGYVTTPQAGGFNQTMHYARGKVLGGTSARNYMVYQRPTIDTLQRWADTVGDQSYSFDNFLPFFEKSLNFTHPNTHFRPSNSTPKYDQTVVGDGSGPLSVTFSNFAFAFGSWATKGFQQMGILANNGFLSGNLLGHGWTASTVDAETMNRESSETSFLRAALGHPDYTVYTRAMAKKIVFDANKTATGVIVDTEGFEYVLSARKEVILSAGVFGSPQLLLASGVGPEKDLQSLNIPVVANRPGVGQGMQDHVFYCIAFPVNAPTFSSLGDSAFAAEQAELFDNSASGLLTSTGVDILGWEKVPKALRAKWSNRTLATLATYPADWPEVEYITIAALLGNIQNSRSPGPADGNNYASLAIALGAPRSRGTVTITSPDTYVHPQINPNLLTDQTDIDVMVAGFKRAREFWATEAMQSLVTGEEYFPGTTSVRTDAQIETAIRRDSSTVWHGSCTCAMGTTDDPNAVVDSRARVIGVEGLRVVDLSALPFLPSGHPQPIAYALAEKIACDISGNC
ncbi:putative glucose-methanol-choline oxidoreductase [Xylaria venustula]|nr:putative glucose-methanol-choline oxidoreductase [Xylaria venustula]